MEPRRKKNIKLNTHKKEMFLKTITWTGFNATYKDFPCEAKGGASISQRNAG
jgi:hypothetical protein